MRSTVSKFCHFQTWTPDTAAILHHHMVIKPKYTYTLTKPDKLCRCADVGSSNPHRHDDVAVAIRFVGKRPHLARALFIFQFNADWAFRRGRKEIQNVAGIE